MKGFRKIVLRVLGEKFYKKRFVYDDLNPNYLTVFRQKREPDFFLSIGFVTSRWEPDIYTVEYYLSKNCLHDFRFPDMPFDCMERIGHFLTLEEKKKYFDEECHYEEVADCWWRYISKEDLVNKLENSFPLIIECADRFDNDDLRKRISESKSLEERIELLREIYNLYLEKQEFPPLSDPKLVRKLQAKKELLDIGKATVEILKQKGVGKANRDMICLISCDCYNMFIRKYP